MTGSAIQGFDALVVGGGPAGATAAIALAKGGARTALIERDRSPRLKAGEVVAAEADATLDALGLDRFLDRTGAVALAEIRSLWGAEAPRTKDTLFNAWGAARAIDRRLTEAALLREVRAVGARVFQGTGHTQLSAQARSWSATWHDCDQVRHIHADIVFDATGRTSRHCDSATRYAQDRLIGIVAHSAANLTLRPRLLIEADPLGWWYSTPLPNGGAALAFMTDADLLPRGLARLRPFLRDRLKFAEETKERANWPLDHMKLFARPAGGSLRARIAGPRHVSIGDAAAAYDPLSGQGISMAIVKAAAAVRLFCSEGAAGFDSYGAVEQEVFHQYTRELRQVYSEGCQWPNSAFWSRRIGRNSRSATIPQTSRPIMA